MPIKGVIFDLDGVIVSTDSCHYKAWKRMADEEGIYFDHEINQRLRGVSRMESLQIVLERATKSFSETEKTELAERKNNYYKEYITQLSSKDILPRVVETLCALKESGVKIAIGSSSRNTPAILRNIGLESFFDGVADGNDISRSKPDPEVFILAAKRLNLEPKECIVVEDAEAGIEAAIAAGMRVVGVGAAENSAKANWTGKDLGCFKLKFLFEDECEEDNKIWAGC
jgi:beta-phosphoglucomutase